VWHKTIDEFEYRTLSSTGMTHEKHKFAFIHAERGVLDDGPFRIGVNQGNIGKCNHEENTGVRTKRAISNGTTNAVLGDATAIDKQ
jgi:hypothetical protein